MLIKFHKKMEAGPRLFIFWVRYNSRAAMKNSQLAMKAEYCRIHFCCVLDSQLLGRMRFRNTRNLSTIINADTNETVRNHRSEFTAAISLLFLLILGKKFPEGKGTDYLGEDADNRRHFLRKKKPCTGI